MSFLFGTGIQGPGRMVYADSCYKGNSFQVTFVNYFLNFILSNELEELVVGVL